MITLENICKYYTNRKTIIKALDNINLKILKGDFITLVGQSGSGKSTLLNILGGLSVQTSGNYYFNNIPISKKIKDLSDFRSDNIGFVVQNFALINYKNIFDNIALPLLYKKESKEYIKTKVSEFADKFGITDKLKNFPSELSGGECQRAAIARAVISNPNIILADEPTGSLDEENSVKILEIFRKLNQEGITIIMVTHNTQLLNFNTNIIKLENGKIIQSTN